MCSMMTAELVATVTRLCAQAGLNETETAAVLAYLDDVIFGARTLDGALKIRDIICGWLSEANTRIQRAQSRKVDTRHRCRQFSA